VTFSYEALMEQFRQLEREIASDPRLRKACEAYREARKRQAEHDRVYGYQRFDGSWSGLDPRADGSW
jgi:hypothetical protein